ncbi:glycosyltransferase family 4 protein [Chryseobacterium sp.]|uniref:glycosyltransferase family 4 protein n=1 Tax=Chryseobacterium sp. TaxID=1871047 RepID=UPI0025C6D160|nr:glycosyltransferase family 4 protein [Chryseobacterium sp.]
MKKIVRITTVPVSLRILLKGQLKFMSQYFEVIGLSSDSDEMKKISEEEQIRTFAVDMTRTISPVADIKAVIQLYKILKKEKPDIVHTHTPKAGIVGMMAAYFAGVPFRLHTVAGLPLMEASGIKRKVLNIVEYLTYAMATKVYPNSFGLRDFILENKFTNSEKLKVIGNGSSNGVDANVFNPVLFSEEEKKKLKQELNITKDDFIFIFVGRIVGDKGMNELIEAYSKIRRPDTKLLLVGGYENELDPLQEKTLEHINQSADIISVGFQKDVRPYFSISDALVFPSYREGFPNVVMQAGAMGLVSIVSNINGCNEIIIPGENGLIVSPKNSSELAHAMKMVSEQKNEFEQMRGKAREMITSRYDQKVIWEMLLQEYNHLLQNKK